MKQYVTASDVASTARLTRNYRTSAVLILEGPTDMRFFAPIINDNECDRINAFNRQNAISALEILERESFKGVLTIVDSDFDALESTLSSSRNLLSTDSHDLEMMLLESPSLNKVLTEFGSTEKINTFIKLNNKSILAALIESGLPIGYLRWVSLRENLSLTFENLKFNSFVDKNTLSVDETKLIKTVKNHSMQFALDEEDVKNKMTSLKKSTYDSFHVCCGHDLVNILSIGLLKALGSHDGSKVKPEIIERSLRLSYEYEYFKTTKLYSAIKEWETVNLPFNVLKS